MKALNIGVRGFLIAVFSVCSISACKVPEVKTPAEEIVEDETDVEVPELLADSLKVYRGPDGIRMAMVMVKDGTYLIRFTGSTSVVEGKALPCTVRKLRGGTQLWDARIDGRDFSLLNKSVDRTGKRTYRAFLPGVFVRGGILLEYDEEATKEVSVEDIETAFRKQVADGSLETLQQFDKEKRMSDETDLLGEDLNSFARRCGFSPDVSMDWDSIKERDPENLTLRAECRNLFTELERYCGFSLVNEMLREKLKKVECRRSENMELRFDGGVLTFGYPSQPDDFWNRLRKLVMDETVWSGGENMARIMYRDRTQVCTDGRGNYVGLLPEREPDKWEPAAIRRMFFGNAKELRRLPRRRRGYSDGWFFDPRFSSRTSHYDHVSMLNIDTEKRTCRLFCGKQQYDLRLLEEKDAGVLLKKAKMQEPLERRLPYGLARDRKGIYYYVDRAESEQVKDYRLYRGPLGNLTRMKMTNIVSDSQGDVFATPNGRLRLVLEKEHSFWMVGKRREQLLNVPIEKNLQLIFNDLGVYLGQPYGTPCDVF